MDDIKSELDRIITELRALRRKLDQPTEAEAEPKRPIDLVVDGVITLEEFLESVRSSTGQDL